MRIEIMNCDTGRFEEYMDRENPSKREENLNKFNALFQKLDVIDARVEFLLLKEVL